MVIAGVIAAVYIVLMAGVMLNQRHMMYFPSKYPLEVLQRIADDHRFEPWTNPKDDFIGWKRLTTNQPAKAQVLILHGNAGQALLWIGFADALQQLAPYDVYIVEYPGYGPRPGTPSEKTIYNAATEAVTLLNTNRKTYLVGESLGTGVAAYLAGTFPDRVSGVMLIAPYNNMSALAQHHMKLFPVRWLLRDRYTADDYLKNYHGPVGFLVGGQDRVIPKRFGLKLYEGYQGPKRLWEEPLAGHEELHQQSQQWWQQVIEFWGR